MSGLISRFFLFWRINASPITVKLGSTVSITDNVRYKEGLLITVFKRLVISPGLDPKIGSRESFLRA